MSNCLSVLGFYLLWPDQIWFCLFDFILIIWSRPWFLYHRHLVLGCSFLHGWVLEPQLTGHLVGYILQLLLAELCILELFVHQPCLLLVGWEEACLELIDLLVQVFVVEDGFNTGQDVLGVWPLISLISLVLQEVFELRFIHISDQAHLDGELDAILEKSLLLHVIWRQNILFLALTVLVRTVFRIACLVL